jgi:guanylate kinase
MRAGEEHGRDYFFLQRDAFREAIQNGDLIEYEEIFGNYYGTLRSSVSESIQRGDFVVDVKGALSLRAAFPDDTLLMFIAPPSLDVLATRLRSRHTETDEQIQLRLARAEMEMGHQDQFDVVLVNDDLSATVGRAEELVREHVEGAPQQPSLFERD